MRKGKFGVTFAFYATAAFVLAMFGNMIPCVLLTIFVIAVEKDEWASRQCIQAVGAMILKSIVSEARYIIERPIDWIGFFAKGDYYKFKDVMNYVFIMINDIINLGIIILLVAAAFRVAKEKEASFPLTNTFSNWAYGIVMTRTQNVAPQNNTMQGNQMNYNNMPQNNMAQNNMAQNNMPQNNMPQNNMPQNNMPQNNMPQNNMPQNNMPQNNMPQGNNNPNGGAKKCPKCGAIVTSKFCNKCGSQVD